MGCPLGTLSIRLTRGRELLRKRLAGRGLALTAAGLVDSTLKAGLQVAGGRALGDVVPPQTAALTEGMLQMMSSTKLKLAAGALVFALVLGLAVGGWAALQPSRSSQPEKQVQVAQPRGAVKDPPPAPKHQGRQRLDDAFQAALVAAVHRFAEDGELDHLRAILNKYPRLVNARPTFRRGRKPYWTDDYTALHRAAERGHEEVVGFLIKKGADVNATANLGWTPLHVAAQKGELSVVKRLVKAGAKVEARTVAVPAKVGVPPGSGPGERPKKIPAIPSLTPLEMAKEAKHPRVVEYLKEVGKKP